MMLRNILVVIILCALCKSQSQFCSYNEKTNKCYAQFNCTEGIDDLDNFMFFSECRNEYDYYNEGEYMFLDLILKNLDSSYDFSALAYFQQYSSIIKTLWILNSTIDSIPSQVYTFNNMHELVLAQNKIDFFYINSFVSLNYLKTVNISHNVIRTVEIEEVSSSSFSLVETIDLSYNLIESIQDNSFYSYTHLKYLDMSHNLISEFDILTFEGINSLNILHLSNNRIKEIGLNFAKLINLQTLKLDYNDISKLYEENFRPLSSIVRLNLRSNEIKEIEDKTFNTMQDLEQLDLSYNKISVISYKLFQNNLNLLHLQLFNNNIQQIEPNSFKNAHITIFSISNNSLIGTMEHNMFLGVFVTEINLSRGKLTQLGNNAFSTLGSTLTSLDLSSNLIANISVSSFKSLYLLTKLDLSSNKLCEINFDTSDLKNLTEFYLNDNKIKSIFYTFQGMSSLLKLDLSNNKLEGISSDLLIDLQNLEHLVLSNNFLGNIFSPGTFINLHKLQNLYLVNTNIILYQNVTLSGMLALKKLNSSYGRLSKLSYDSFRDTSALEIIDLSHNMLNIFNVNTSHFKNVQELYLNDNLLTHIAIETFSNLYKLRKLNLASNNIEVIEPKSIQQLGQLNFLNLSSNNNMKMDSCLFNNLLYLSEIYLNNINTPLSFNKSSNVSITVLYVSFSNIIDVGSVELFRIKDILKLVLSSNKINYLDKRSFASMPTLDWLDLSENMINYVQPGTFKLTPRINVLNLARNCILSLEFGVLDGLENLRNLNLSSNAIHTFSSNILHNTPYLTHLSLDNNNIIQIDFNEFANKNLQELSIGGNLISCDTFIAWNQSSLSDMMVTAEQLLYNVENVHGIRCKTLTKSNGTINEGIDVNFTSHLSKLIKIQQKFFDIYEKSINTSTSLKKEDIRNVFSNFATELKEILDRKEVDKNEQWKHYISNISNIWFSAFENITTMTNKILMANNNMTDSIQNTQNNLIRSILQEIKSADTRQMDTLLQTDSTVQTHDSNQGVYYLSDMKVLLNIISICLAGIFVVLLSLITYLCFIFRNKVKFVMNSVNPQTLANSIEL